MHLFLGVVVLARMCMEPRHQTTQLLGMRPNAYYWGTSICGQEKISPLDVARPYIITFFFFLAFQLLVSCYWVRSGEILPLGPEGVVGQTCLHILLWHFPSIHCAFLYKVLFHALVLLTVCGDVELVGGLCSFMFFCSERGIYKTSNCIAYPQAQSVHALLEALTRGRDIQHVSALARVRRVNELCGYEAYSSFGTKASTASTVPGRRICKGVNFCWQNRGVHFIKRSLN